MATEDKKENSDRRETEDLQKEDQSLNDTAKDTSMGDEGKDEDAAQPEKKKRDCRDHCMHCGNHCIYLK